jgi:hypothetical protein
VGLKTWFERVKRLTELERRVRNLEQDVAELRQHNLRLAELTDVVEQLVIPIAKRDEAAVDAAIAKFTESL